MKDWCILLTINLLLIPQTWGSVILDSTAKERFHKLAKKMRLKTPKLEEGEYEVRIWKNRALLHGYAQELHRLSKNTQQLTISKYIIRSGKRRFRSAVKLNPIKPVADTLWQELLQNDILTLPDQYKIDDKIHPKQPKDSTYVVMEKDGSATVHARKQVVSFYILDGEGYYFEIFGKENYRIYTYSNPRGYFRGRPTVSELQNVVAILNKLATFFPPSN